MQITQNPTTFSQIFIVFLKSKSISEYFEQKNESKSDSEYFEKKDETHSLSISVITDSEKGRYLIV